jgi:hypothetical protein
MLKSNRKPTKPIQDRRRSSPVASEKIEQGIKKKGFADWVPPKSEMMKQVASRKKLKETEKVVLGGMEKAKGWDRVKVAEMAEKRSADALKTLNDALAKSKAKPKPKSKIDGKLPQGLPNKGPIPPKKPKR